MTKWRVLAYAAVGTISLGIGSIFVRQPIKQPQATQPLSLGLNTNQGLVLTSTQIAQLQALALKGDGEAAYRLALFYGGVMNDGSLEKHWIQVASDTGLAKAQYYLAHIRGNESDDNALSEADLLLLKAEATANIEHDFDLLRSIRYERQSIQKKRMRSH